MNLHGLVSWWPVLLLGAFGCLLIAFSLLMAARRFRKRRRGRRPASPFLRFTLSLLTFSLFVSGLCIVLAVWVLISNFFSYQALTRLEKVAEIECMEPASSADSAIRLLYTPVSGGTVGPSSEFALRGEQWLLGADVVKWQPFMHYLGFHTHYKITRLEGRYVRATDQSQQTITAYSLNGGTDPFWAQLYRTGSAWPLHYVVDDVYGSAVYQFADPGSTFDVFISTSGLVARRR